MPYHLDSRSRDFECAFQAFLGSESRSSPGANDAKGMPVEPVCILEPQAPSKTTAGEAVFDGAGFFRA
jgi:hypothetical protein